MKRGFIVFQRYVIYSQDDERLHDYNVKERVDSFIKAAQDQVSLRLFEFVKNKPTF